MTRSSRAVFLLYLILASAGALSGQTVDVIRGRITTPDSQPVPDVNVTVTSFAGGVSRTTRTNRSGRFQVTFANGEGDYWIALAAIGFEPRRYQVRRIGEEEVLLANAQMVKPGQRLPPIIVVAKNLRNLAMRASQNTDVSGTQRGLTNATLPPDTRGDLAAMAALVPGIQQLPGADGAAGMFSVLGLGGDQNNTSFNGLGAGLDALPRDAVTSPSVAVGTYDVSSGRYSGAQISISTVAGNNFLNQRMSGAGRSEGTEWSGQSAEEQGVKNTWLSLGGMTSGPIVRNWDFYSSSFQYDRTFSNLHTLLNTGTAGLAAAGIARDSADRLVEILGRQGIPVVLPSSPTLVATDQIRGQANLDFTPQFASGAPHSFTLAIAGTYSRSQPVGVNFVSAVPLAGVEAERWNGIVSLRHLYSFFLGEVGIQSRTTIGVSSVSATRQPYLNLPGGTVRVSSDLGDGQATIRTLTFGGNTAGAQSQRTTNIEFLNQLLWFSADNTHAFKLTTNVSRESYRSTQAPNRLGTWSYNSLADLEGNTPSSFARTVFAPDHGGGQLVAAVGLGDAWRPSSVFQLQYGVRGDANRYTSAPELNPAVAAVFGVANTHVPNRIYLSPRAGFQWTYGKAAQISAIAGGVRAPRALVRGGVGIFQNVGDAQLIRSALDATGLSSSTQRISCVGVAVPEPQWNDYREDPTAIPSTCADGSAGTTFGTAAPSVAVFDDHYAQARSLRASLGWGGAVLGNRFALGAAATWSRNSAQSSAIDLNLNRQSRFTLTDEAGRPVYADPTAIVPNTGAVDSRASRSSTDFDRVTLLSSDLHSTMRQVTLNLQPLTSSTQLRWALDYTLQLGTEDYRGGGVSGLGFGTGSGGGGFGYGNNTDGDPLAIHRGPALNSRHVFGFSVLYNAFDLIRLTTRVQLRSPVPYTPMVVGDVNGDGSGNNDRAFIFDPAVANDPAVAGAMTALLAGGSASARACLAAQLGRIASRGSCTGPWTVSASLGVNFNPQKIGLPQRMNISFAVTNPLLLADLIAHGNGDLHGWGQTIQPDQALLFVRGFDPARSAFTYEVNQRFGSTRPNQANGRGLAYLSLNLSFDLGPTRERQILTQSLDYGRSAEGKRQSAASLKAIATSTIPNPMSMILQQPEALQLTRVQADSLASMSLRLTKYADSVWIPVATALEALPGQYDRDDAYARYRRAREITFDQLIRMAPAVEPLLTPAQWRLLPAYLRNYLDHRVLRSMRSSTANPAMDQIYIR